MSEVARPRDQRMSWKEGDWMCGACQHHNFRERNECQRCGYPKFGGPADVKTFLDNVRSKEVRPGDWYCTNVNCGAHNFASRSNCYICGALKNVTTVCGLPDASHPPGWKAGDWICNRMGCGAHNYARRTECYGCKKPKE